MQSNKKSFEGQKIFIGIDVHAKTWAVETLTESGFRRRHSQKASAKELFEFLRKNFPGAEYHAVYESGFSGFSTYYDLERYGIECTVVHAADVPTTQYEEVMKNDRRDAGKLARDLRNGELKAVYIRKRENLDDRAVVRLRSVIQKSLAGCKVRLKHLLYCNGVEMPERFMNTGTHWSRAFMGWLKDEVVLLSPTRLSLDLLIKQVETDRQNLLEANRTIRRLSASDKYRANYELLMSIPGVGCKVAMSLLTEIYDFGRFPNERTFAHYLGLVPTCHDSGEKKSAGVKTFRGNKPLGPMIIEASWVAVRKDYGLSHAYGSYLNKNMTPQQAIVKIARKMSNIIFAVIKTGKKYEPYKWEE